MNEPMRVQLKRPKGWKMPRKINDLFAEFRPKVIREYTEDGKVVKVYEGR